MWNDCVGGLYDGCPADEVQRSGLIAWEPPWDISGWEISEGFWRKWAWMLRPLGETVLESTNRWRVMRGEKPLAWQPEEDLWRAGRLWEEVAGDETLLVV